MSLTCNAKEYQSMILQVSQNQPKQSLRGFSVLHPNQVSLVGMRNGKIIIIQLFQLTVYFNCKYFS